MCMTWPEYLLTIYINISKSLAPVVKEIINTKMEADPCLSSNERIIKESLISS